MKSHRASAMQIANETAQILAPTVRVGIMDHAAAHLHISTPGGYSGPVRPDIAPYMNEPLECLKSRDYQTVTFVGPARSLKTFSMGALWIAHTIECDPSDLMVLAPTQDFARDYSKREIDRFFAANPRLKDRLRPMARADNTFDKFFRSGMILSFGWPTISILAGKTIGRMLITDYDRMADDLDGQGSIFEMARKRGETFMSRAKVACESSPGKQILDPKWKPNPAFPHEAPPTTGVLGLFNSGDRRRLYWQCQGCAEYWMPPCSIEAFAWDRNESDPGRAGESARVPCPQCGYLHRPDEKAALLVSAKWVREGLTINRHGLILGDGRTGNNASFWLPGVAACFQPWRGIVTKYVSAMQTYESTGEQETLKSVVNLDIGAPYLYLSQGKERDAEVYDGRKGDWQSKTVPEFVRFLTACADVQQKRFVVQVQGWGVGSECAIVDRFDILLSERLDAKKRNLPVAPATYFEDWLLLREQMIDMRYPLCDGSGRTMGIIKCGCDSAGEAGVTEKAYQFWRRIRKEGLVRRFCLVKGAGQLGAPLHQQIFPDTIRKGQGRGKASYGDVPVQLLNVNMLKDAVDGYLNRPSPGPGFVHFPANLEKSFYDELAFETRTEKGWVAPPGRNEAFDLMGYNLAIAKICGLDKIKWDAPPPWANVWDMNPMVSRSGNDAVHEKQEYIPRQPAVRSRVRYQLNY